MGWWQDDWDGKRIELGDEPIDLVHDLLRAFARSYTEDRGRAPESREFLASLFSAMQTTGRDLFSDLQERELTAIKLALKSAPKTRKFVMGDYFAIPLSSGEFAYGRILGKDGAGSVIEVYRFRTRNQLPVGQLKTQAKDSLLQTHVNGLLSFRSGRWPILGHDDLPKKHPMPSFRLGSPFSVWLIACGDQQRPASVEEVLRLEPMVCWDPETVETRITSDHPEVWPELEEWQCQAFGDRYLKILRDPAKLRKLYLQSAEVTDAGLKHLTGCTGLKTLNLATRPITDAGLRHLSRLDGLDELDLGRTRVTDAGLVHLRGLKGIKKLGLVGTQVTDQAVTALKRALPGAEILK
jgi:Immunity protein 26